MLAFGREGVLKHNEIESVVTYVRYLSESDPNKPMPETLKAGAAVFPQTVRPAMARMRRANWTSAHPISPARDGSTVAMQRRSTTPSGADDAVICRVGRTGFPRLSGRFSFCICSICEVGSREFYKQTHDLGLSCRRTCGSWRGELASRLCRHNVAAGLCRPSARRNRRWRTRSL